MSVNSLGDLGQGYMLRGRSASLKQDMQRLTTELTTGQVADVRGQLAGNYSFLTDIERKVEVLGHYKVASNEATQFTTAMQLALGNFSDQTQELSSSLLVAGTSSSAGNTLDFATQTRATLDGMISTMNSSIAGRSLFAGNATDQTAIVDSNTLIADLATAMSGATTPDGMLALADAWFDSPAGFAASAYQGGDTSISSFALSPSDNVTVDVRATDPGFTQALRAAAVASLATDPAFGLSELEQADLYFKAGQNLLAAQNGTTGLQAKVGFAEERIETLATRNATEVTSLSIARNTLLGADPYKTASELEEVQFQLQSLYSVTVRMSQLSLVNYL